MYTIDKYIMAESLEQAKELLKKSSGNRIIAGSTWLRMSNARIANAVDLSGLHMDKVEQNGREIRIGAMAALRTVETSPVLKNAFGGVLSECVKPIVGVQFRNVATIGAGVYNCYAFSDPVCALLALDAEVELCFAGRMKLSEYIKVRRTPKNRDILCYIYLNDDGTKAAWQSFRHTETDFPILNACLAEDPAGAYRLAIGARPDRAVRCEKAEACLNAGDLEAAKKALSEIGFGSNMTASAEYRAEIAKVLLERAFTEVSK